MRYIYLFLFLFSQVLGIVNTEVYRNSNNNSEKNIFNLGFSISNNNTNQSQFRFSNRYDFKLSDIDGFTVSSLLFGEEIDLFLSFKIGSLFFSK